MNKELQVLAAKIVHALDILISKDSETETEIRTKKSSIHAFLKNLKKERKSQWSILRLSSHPWKKMESFRTVIKKSAAKEIERIEKTDRIRIIEKIRSLANDPRLLGNKKLSGQEKYRIRQGNYRILYQVIDHELIINVVKVGYRRDIYDN